MSGPRESAAYAALITAAVVWGGSIVAQKVALGAFSAVEVSVFRGIGALGILIPLWWWKDQASTKWAFKDIGILSALGMGVLGNHLLILYGLQFIDAGAAGVIIGASPTITAVLSSLFLKDVPFSRVWVGCAISFVGVAIVSGGNASGDPGDKPLLGGILVVLALVSWALYTIGSRHVMERMTPLTVNWTTLLISILIQIPLLWTDHKVLDVGLASVSASGWMALVYVVVFATALGQQAWLYGVSGIGPSRAGVFINLIPVSSLLLSLIILGESFDVVKIIGIILVLSGVWLVTRSSTS
ncbi:DMT family transporter [Candidatus Nitronereus thalassa]|uniref:DMT family transporter n=1 Tax=Candidatus Nitronereus thalassa TaxID=3020898 RepID=A0ABU3K880_9BACT|nr:DMT family transporter [Candidatus Nitronereus thalassa]MDT7042564.1 DMT family transporter [Candidatus Nitronereus thalassa]